MKSKSLLRYLHASAVVPLIFMQTALASVFAVFAARWLGPSDRGVIVIVTTISSLFSLGGSLGVATGGRMLLARNDSRFTLMNSQYSATRLASIQVLTTVAVGWPLLYLGNGWSGLPGAFAFVVYAACLVAIVIMREAVHGVGKHKAAVGADIAMLAVQLIGISLLQLLWSVNVVNLLWLMAAAAIFEVWYLRVVLARIAQSSETGKLTLHELVRISAPALISNLGQAFVMRGDRLLLGVLSDSKTVGIYGTAATFAEAITLSAVGFSQLAFRASAQGAYDRLRIIRLANFLFATTCFGLLYVAGGPIFLFLVGPHYASGVPVMRALAFGNLCLSVFIVETAVQNGAGHLRRPAIATTVSAALLGGLCVLLIPRFGVWGAVSASILSYFTLAVLVSAKIKVSSRVQTGSPHGQ